MNSRNLGAYAALIAAGESPGSVIKMACDSELPSSHDRMVFTPVAKIAAQLFDVLRDNSVEANVFRVIAAEGEKSASWGSARTEAVLCFVESVKQATALKSLVEWPAAAMMAGGGTLGTLYWLLNREASQDDADAEKLRSVRDLYRDIAAETKNRMKRTQGETPADAFSSAHSTIDAI